MIVQNISILELIVAYFVEFGYPEAILINKEITIDSNNFLIQFRYILRDYLPTNAITSIFLDIERRILSYFLIFAFLSLFLSTGKYFKKQYRDIINFGKISLIMILIFYVAEIVFKGSSNIFAQSLPWFKWRTIEAFAGPLIILTCFAIEKVIDKAKLLTFYLSNKSRRYRFLINNNSPSRILKIENIIVLLVLISSMSVLQSDQRIYASYYFEKDQIDTIFYIKENVPYDSKILVSDFNDGPNCLYNLLSTYQKYKWDFEFDKNTFNETLEYIIEKGIEYILLDYTMINSTEKSYFTSFLYFDEMYENEYNIVFEVELDKLEVYTGYVV